MFIIRFLLFQQTRSQSFKFEGESSSIYLSSGETSYTLYNEDQFSIVDSSSTPAMTLNQSSSCIATFDRRLLIHGGLLGSTKSSHQHFNFEQWKLVIFEDFESQISGWSEDDISNCGGSPDLFLGGYCKFSSKTAKKNFTLPAHQAVRVSATFHFIDKWEGESGYLKLDEKFVWSESFVSCNNLRASVCQSVGINVCGSDYPDRIGYRLSYSGPHNSTSLLVEFATTLTRDPCEVSWGVDDIEIFIR